MNTPEFRKIGIATAIMMASVFLSRVIGLGREMVIAWVGGTSGAVDAYQVAFVLPEILNHVVASGFLSVTFIPILSRYLSAGREAEGWRVLWLIHNSLGLLLLLLIGIAELLAPQLVRLLAPGLNDPATLAAAVRMTRIILPAQLCFFSGGLFMAAQFCRERFFIPALAPLIYNLGIIAGGVMLGPRLGMEGFAWGVLAGALLGNGLLQLWGARRVGLRWLAAFGSHPDLWRYLRLTLPLMLGLTMGFSTEIFFKLFGSFLPAGAIAALNYGLRVMLMMVALCGQALGAASFPFLARLAAEGRREELHRLLNASLRYLALVIPFAALMIAVRHEVVLLLFQRGRFDAAATALTARLLVPLLAGAFAFAAQTVVARGFYALQNTWLPALWGTLATLLGVPLYWAGLRLWGADGVACAVSLAAILQAAVLWIAWNRFGQNPAAGTVWRGYGRMLLLGAGLTAVLEAARGALPSGWQGADWLGSLLTVLALSGLFLILLVLAAKAFRIEELTELLDRIWRRRRRAARVPAPPPTQGGTHG